MEADRTNTSSSGGGMFVTQRQKQHLQTLVRSAAELSANVGRFIFCAARTHPAQNGQLKQTQHH
jgi:hypothetical protein